MEITKEKQDKYFKRLIANSNLNQINTTKPFFFALEKESFFAIQFSVCHSCLKQSLKISCKECFATMRDFYKESPNNISIFKIKQDKFSLTN